MASSDLQPADPVDPEPFAIEAQGHSLAFFPGGQDRLDALLDLIAGAQTRLQVAFYIFATDKAGVLVRDALTEAARRGVDVHVILDGFGADADRRFFAPMIEAGGTFNCFIAKFTRRYLIRNHQKIVIADGKVAMLGGFNVEDSYFALTGDRWSDLAFTVEGPVVERIGQWFSELEDWASHPDAQLLSIRRKVREWRGGTGPVQLLIGGPTGRLSSWARSVSADLVEGERLDMIMAYFSPSRRLAKRIRRIARKGRTRLLFPAKSDNGATIGAARAYYTRLLEAGARIWEFEPCKLHTKLIVLDDAVYLGSANFDARSLFINLEIVLFIQDAALARRLSQFMESLLPASIEITPELHASRATWWNRLRWRLSRFLVAAVDYTVTRSLNLGQ
ncbi:phosphatidylserine/phosphatidylglycerophosphate/cardiolipin synthase family protein [Croceibacterium sp. LX-88]|uniref:Phospholipase D n=1 Tax=Croceibacterium selenioxidans TaxID=2838833 RepID=A0ABS5W5H9_9SPHN|nr:phosphatidylserine/phosphatidylglycerophosphate/cardiolipin synthase family protein [Croceibacterium selenioxidans]MBT2134996.1 phosphatidylserine/phosphatidylglycerophosphate/cardiolipin synthase family protein [Croceibacterium selenioxidans]